jgi:hypothetical protein
MAAILRGEAGSVRTGRCPEVKELKEAINRFLA